MLVTTVTGGAVNTKGSWVQAIAATAFDTDLLAISVRSAGVDQNLLADIGIGAAASEVVIVPNLYDSYDGLVADNSRANGSILCPVSIPKGTRIATRGQASLVNGTGGVIIVPCGGGFRRASPLGTITDYGTDTANSRGTAVVSGAAAFGSWTQLTAATTRTIHALAFMEGCLSLTGATGITVDIGIGTAGNEIAVIEGQGVARGSVNGGDNGLSLGFLPCLIPSGARLSARVNSNAADTFYIIAYGAS